MNAAFWFFLALLFSAPAQSQNLWTDEVRASIFQIQKGKDGNLGVYLKAIPGGPELRVDSDRYWYLASTVKVPVAIILLQGVERGEYSLNQSLTVKESDFVDGTGDLRFAAPGTKFSLRSLLEKMVMHSDSTAADLLIRFIGEEKLNARLSKISKEFGRVTDLLSVRRDAYGEVHPQAKKLSNLDFIQLKSFKDHGERMEALRAKLQLSKEDLKTPTIAEAFERYYSKRLNSSTLTAFGLLLEKLAQGKLLSPEHTGLLLDYMTRMSTGEKRIKAGLGKGLKFAQKTGTQIRRVCNVGIISKANLERRLVIVACVEKFRDQNVAEGMLRDLGRAITRSDAFRVNVARQ